MFDSQKQNTNKIQNVPQLFREKKLIFVTLLRRRRLCLPDVKEKLQKMLHRGYRLVASLRLCPSCGLKCLSGRSNRCEAALYCFTAPQPRFCRSPLADQMVSLQ